MPPERDWRLRLGDILTSAERAVRYAHGHNRDSFAGDQLTIDAVVRNLEVIGEAVRHVPAAVAEQYPHIPWDEMRGMRNILAHEYAYVNVEIVWLTVQRSLPPLIEDLRQLRDSGVFPG